METCERCGEEDSAYDFFDYCAVCDRSLCERCMAIGCCSYKPALSGKEAFLESYGDGDMDFLDE